MVFADNRVDHALASHMLYHVPDIRRALEEMKRVVKVGGRVLMTTNAADHSARLNEPHAQAARDLGLTPPWGRSMSGSRLTSYRWSAQSSRTSSSTDSPMRSSSRPSIRRSATTPVAPLTPSRSDIEGSHRPALSARMAELIGEIIAHEGVFRVPKDAGSFLATVEA